MAIIRNINFLRYRKGLKRKDGEKELIKSWNYQHDEHFKVITINYAATLPLFD